MIVTIIIVSSAFYWLLRETNYLRINLTSQVQPCGDLELEYDGSDADYLPDYDQQFNDMIKDFEYQDWLDESHAPIRRTTMQKGGGDYFTRQYNRESTKEMRERQITCEKYALINGEF